MRPDTAAALELPVTGDSVGPVAVQFSYSATWRDSSVRPGERLQRLARETLSPEVGGVGGWAGWVVGGGTEPLGGVAAAARPGAPTEVGPGASATA